MSNLLKTLAMTELRALASDLEPLVERELRSSKKKELVDLVAAALSEVEASDAETFGAILDAHKLTDENRPESTESDSDEGGDEEAEAVEEVPEPPAPKASKAESTELELRSEDDDLPYAIQVREHSRRFPYNYGEIVIGPTRELVEGLVHAKLTEDGVKKLVARGSRTRKM